MLLFAVIALVLAASGIYAMVNYIVGQRMHEFAVRIAVGAGQREVTRLALSATAWLLVAGLAVGLGGAVAVTRLIESRLYAVKPADPATFVAVAVLLSLVVLAAAYLPARRATRADPMRLLRCE